MERGLLTRVKGEIRQRVRQRQKSSGNIAQTRWCGALRASMIGVGDVGAPPGATGGRVCSLGRAPWQPKWARGF